VPILILHALYFQIPENRLGQWHHHCSNTQTQPYSTNHPSLTIHHLPRRCSNPSLVEAQGECRSQPSQTPKDYFWGSEKVHGTNCIHEDSLVNIIWRQVLDGWRNFATCHWSLASSAGISWGSCRYTISVSITQWSISHNWSADTRSCKSSVLFNGLLSDLQYWLCPKWFIVENEQKYHLRMVVRWGKLNCCP